MVNEPGETYSARVTWLVPTGTISIDFPQNLFLHLTSAESTRDKQLYILFNIHAEQPATSVV